MDILDLKYDFKSSSIDLDEDTFFIYAHTKEFLNEHLLKTMYVFENLIDKNIINHFYKTFQDNNLINLSFDEFWDIIMSCVYFHDIGKISFNFQINRLNSKNKQGIIQKDILKKHDLYADVDCLTADHSLTSSLTFLSKYEPIFEDNKIFLLVLAYAIYGHHTNIKDLLLQSKFAYGMDEDVFETFALISLFLDIATSEENILERPTFQNMQDTAFKLLYNEINDMYSPISFFYMYIYSLLISADVFASSKYDLRLDEVKKINFNERIDSSLKEKMSNSFYSKPYNNNLDYDEDLDLGSVNDINILRKQMLLESSKNLKDSINSNNVFFLHMPTGGGKTNTSMKLALDIIENTDADRIIYAMPFINIIEQNFDVICDSFGLSEECGEIRKIYSGSEVIFPNKDDDFKSHILLSDDFFNYPVVCTTFVSLFNSVIKNNKKLKFKLASLTNSVIILDEIQSLPLKNWNSLYYIINELANNYNIYFIVMSATLPNFEKLKLDSESNLYFENISLIDNPSKYFNHYLFSRTEIKDEIKTFEFNEENYEDFIEYLWDIIQKNFNQGFTKGLMVFNTIKSSRLVFEKLSEFMEEKLWEDESLDRGDVEIDLLNSSLMPSTKREIISKINNFDDNQKYILISTQSIEAGVDVSFDFVVRDFAIIDSIEQVRGRCNRSRELNKRFNDEFIKGNVYLTKLINKRNRHFFEYIYEKAEMETRINCTEELFENYINYSFSEIDNYYQGVSNLINSIQDEKEKSNFIDRDNIKHLNNLNYSKLMDKIIGIHIINNTQEQFSIFVCADVNVFSEHLDENIFDMDDKSLEEFYLSNKNKFIFSLNELKFIKSFDYDEKVYGMNCVHGDVLLDYYRSLLKKVDKTDYFQYRLLQKEFSSIFYKFIINVSVNFHDELCSEIKSLEQVGYFYVLPKEYIGDGESDFCSLKTGFNYKPTILKLY